MSFLLLLLLAAVTGCHATHYVDFRGPESGPPPVSIDLPETADTGFQSFLFWGLVEAHTIDAAMACGGPGGVKAIRTGRSAAQTFLYALSAGVFAPYTAEIECTTESEREVPLRPRAPAAG